MAEDNTNNDPAAEVPVGEPATEAGVPVVPATEESSAPLNPEVPASPAVAPTPVAPRKTRPKWFFGALAAILVLVVAGGAYGYFGVYLQTPENVWKTSLRTTREGLKAFAEKGPSTKLGAKVDGAFKMTTPVAADGTISGSTYKSESDMKFDVGTSGVRVNAELRTTQIANAENPDLYLKVKGIKGIAPLISADPGVNALADSIEDKWLFADHTLFDEVEASTGTGGLSSESPEQLVKDVHDIQKKLTAVINDRLLSDDPSKAVIVIKEKLGKEDFKGRSSQHLKVKIQKQQLRDFAVAFKDAIKSSKLNDWLLSESDKTLEETINFNDLLKEIDGANYDDAVADVWVDLGYKTIRNVRIYDDPKDQSSYFDLFFDYKGNDEYPFIFNVVTQNATGSQDIKVGVSINRVTDKTVISVDGKGSDKTGKKLVDITGQVSITPTDDKVNVEKPQDAVNITNLLAGYLGQAEALQNQLKVNPLDSGILQ